MIINPIAGIGAVQNTYAFSEEKITEIIQEFIRRYPELYVNATDPYQVVNEVNQLLVEKGYKIPAKIILDNMFGYGIIEHLLEDTLVTDIFINNEKEISYKKWGKIIETNLQFKNRQAFIEYIKRVAIMNGANINMNEADTTFTDVKRGLRITAAIPPVAIKPFLHIRRPLVGQKLETLVKESGMLTTQQAEILKQALRERKTIIIAGRGGSGKTTLLSSLVEEIPEHIRVGIIQEVYEIRTERKNTILELTRSGSATLKEYSLFELTKNMLLRSIETIVVGELKDRETFDVLNAVHTGHQALATVHSPSAQETINRLIFLMKRAQTDLSETFLREILESSIDYIVYMKDYRVDCIFQVGKKVEIVC
ncbi:ATPase, T2SS/T4P/T4SS family [Caldicellulosiruptor morganii]|uniref:ATPase, T2SS/T4P/T4SS family n=1 Tax=Caldicellulosiruptor morganii TaxID=1387555 RepID=A0ABY7BLN7_9FIRM|nr:ATPase, T2SS/T4P/T4SS family [Caldicellulosiruptor morganii]WAM33313.1 ATPase, T2SS/T4P/T4SS family [Caldicellulosiruptor morganii]